MKLLVSFIIIQLLIGVQGHGFIIDPPSRSSAWRHGFETPKNYDDDGLNCGGFGTLWSMNRGRCGPCGDPWHYSRPRPNELGGRYGMGVIVRNYTEGQDIPIRVYITANHLGYFEFRICPDPEDETQECFDQILLTRKDRPRNTRYHVGGRRGMLKMVYRLPEGLTCDHCILQWFYKGGNNWGVCPDGSSQQGCGPQEQFKNCADISIL